MAVAMASRERPGSGKMQVISGWAIWDSPTEKLGQRPSHPDWEVDQPNPS